MAFPLKNRNAKFETAMKIKFLLSYTLIWLAPLMASAQQDTNDYTKLISGDAYFLRGVLAAKQARFENAMADFSMAIQLDPTNSMLAYMGRGTLKADRNRDFDGAIADFSKALELQPKNKYAKYEAVAYFCPQPKNQKLTAKEQWQISARQ